MRKNWIKLGLLVSAVWFFGVSDAVAQDPGKPVRIENPKELKPAKIDKNAEKLDIKKEEIKKDPEKVEEKQLTKPIIEGAPKPKPDAPAKIEPRKEQVKPVQEIAPGRKLPEPAKEAAPKPKPDKPIKEAAPKPKPDKPIKAAPEPPKKGRPVGELKDKPEKDKNAHKERHALTPEQKECKIERTACRQDCKSVKNECGKGKNCAELHKACKAECDKKFVCH
ncbi:MAG: hypothetical protein IJM59_05520 [Proteobacteria bacterium]|nr:hypothetical protein [Pseudomonadota bacterium]